ncbi:MAG: hypothetical protein OER82_04200 [Nitrosopumilus sp.]|nr:hypothetical protein [Nitrosopumilus sp.]
MTNNDIQILKDSSVLSVVCLNENSLSGCVSTATLEAIIGLMIAVSTWVMIAASLPEFVGVIDLASLDHNHSMLFGNVAGILSGGAIAIIGSLAANKTFDWNDLKYKITLVEIQVDAIKAEEDEETLKKAFQFSLKGSGIMTLVLIIAWPMPLIVSGYVFDLGSYSV